MPRADFRDIGREQAYGYSPSGPGPYAPSVRRLPPDLQPYYNPSQSQAGTSHRWGSGGYGDSPSGPYGQHFAPGGLATGPRYETQPRLLPPSSGPIDVATPQQPAAASPTGWWENLQKMLQSANAGLDPARTPGRPPSTPDPSQFIRQPRTIQTTDPGAGYGMSPSGPTARLGSAQFPDTPSDAPREGTWMHGNVQRPQGQAVTYMERGGSPYRGQSHTSPSHPRYRGPAPGDNVIETTDPGRGYRGSPSNPNWQPRPKPMSPFFEPPRPPVGGPR